MEDNFELFTDLQNSKKKQSILFLDIALTYFPILLLMHPILFRVPMLIF